MNEPINIVITANGRGERMKSISPVPKHLLYYGGKRIIDHIPEALEPFGPVEVLEGYPTENRRETLELLRGKKNVLICDCDVIPQNWIDPLPKSMPDVDVIWYFHSDNPKYGGLEMSETGMLAAAKERGQGHKYRASGLYFLKDVGVTLDRMTDPNSLAAAMVGARMVRENTFIRLGDPEDYLNALK